MQEFKYKLVIRYKGTRDPSICYSNSIEDLQKYKVLISDCMSTAFIQDNKTKEIKEKWV